MVSARLSTCAVLLRTIFCTSCKEGFPGIFIIIIIIIIIIMIRDPALPCHAHRCELER